MTKESLKLMSEHKDDIVEYALTFGIKKSGKRFHLNDKLVKDILHEFVIDNSVSKLCQCQLAYTAVMAKCVICDMPIESNETQYVIHNNIYCAHCAYRATALLQIEKEQQQQNKFYNKQINGLLKEVSDFRLNGAI